jgi:hypothetical protein
MNQIFLGDQGYFSRQCHEVMCDPAQCVFYLRRCVLSLATLYSRAPLIRINLDGEPSGYAEIPDNWIFLLK